MPKNWNRRFKHNRDKMKTATSQLAEVVRNLSLRDREKGLSTGEKQMFVKAKKILPASSCMRRTWTRRRPPSGSTASSSAPVERRTRQRP